MNCHWNVSSLKLGRLAAQYLILDLFLHADIESDVRMTFKSPVFKIYDLLAGEVIFWIVPNHFLSKRTSFTITAICANCFNARRGGIRR